jgi:hypothetical protein
MAVGKTAQCSVSEVAAHSKSLEVSPSKNSPSSPVYGKGKTASQPAHPSSGKTHAGKRGTKETPEKFGAAHAKKGH